MPNNPAIPPELRERIAIKLQRHALGDALKLCRQNDIPLDEYGEDIARLVNFLHASRAFGVILSAYHDYGQISDYSVTDLLLAMFEAGDYPSFLKQAHRFGYYQECAKQIEAAISWHRDRGLKDVDAWERKFAELRDDFERNSRNG